MSNRPTPDDPAVPDVLPILPLRDTVVFPLAVTPLLVGQERSVKLVDDAMRANRLIGLVAQRNVSAHPAEPGDLYRIGTMAVIHQLLRGQDGTLRLLVQGLERVRIGDFVRTEPYLVAGVAPAPSTEASGIEAEALMRTIRGLFKRLVALMPELSDEMESAVEVLTDPCQLVSMVVSNLPIDLTTRQEILELDSVEAKLRRLVDLLQHELAVRELGKKITAETKEQMSKAQRD